MLATTAVGSCQLLTGAAIDSTLFGRIMARDSSLPAFHKATSSQPSLLPLYTTQRVQARSSPRFDVGALRTAVCNLCISAEVLVHQTNTGGNSIPSCRKQSPDGSAARQIVPSPPPTNACRSGPSLLTPLFPRHGACAGKTSLGYVHTSSSQLLTTECTVAGSVGPLGCIVWHCPCFGHTDAAALQEFIWGVPGSKADAHLQANPAPQLLLPTRENGCGLGEGGARRGNSLPPWAFVVSALLEPRLPVHRTQLSSTK